MKAFTRLHDDKSSVLPRRHRPFFHTSVNVILFVPYGVFILVFYMPG
jgi:hypothetical protein